MSVPPIDEILSRASRAPSVHNTQPWTWHVSGARLSLRADFTRQLMYADPQRRDLMISCGAALHHLQVAAAGAGWSTRVQRSPDHDDDRVVASVRFTPSRVSPEQSELVAALDRRRTDRRRLTSWPVPDERLERLAGVGSSWGAQVLPVTGEAARSRLYRLTRRADQLQQRNERYVAELAAWIEVSPVEGVPADHIPVRTPVDAVVSASDAVNRRFAHGRLEDPVTEDEPTRDGLLLVCTSSDDTISWIRAGEALSALWLAATVDNLAVVPLSQAIEVDRTRDEVREAVLDDLAFPQILVRLGWPPLDREPLSPTPRRPLAEVVVRD